MRTLDQLKGLFRQKIKVVTGGPANQTRGMGMLAVLDALAEEIKAGGYTALTLAAAQQLRVADPPGVVANTLYGITGKWNGDTTNSTVYLHGVTATAYHRLGVVYDAQGVGQLVQVDAAAGAYSALNANDPRFGATTAADPAAPLSALGWVLVGIPARRNVALGPLAAGTTLAATSYYNVFGYGIQGCTFSGGLYFNEFGSVQNNHQLGLNFQSNVFGAGCSDVRFGDNCQYNELGAGISLVRAGNGCTGNKLAAQTAYVTLGNNVKGCFVGPGCSAVTLSDGCERIELYNCGRGDYGNPFVIAAGSKDQVWRNNVLVGTGAGPSLPTVDLLALTTDQMKQVMALTYTDCDADPADSPAWSRPGHWFDALDSQGRNCHFYCGRGTYDPNAPQGTTGAGPAWHYTLKLG